MPKGGLKKNSKGNYDHLFSKKWNRETTVIRIPKILKDEFLRLAKYLDENENLETENINLVDKFSNRTNQNKYLIVSECFQEFLQEQELDIEQLRQSRSGTKKRQLADIHDWFLEKAESNF